MKAADTSYLYLAEEKNKRRCLSCGTSENMGRRRYCSVECRQRLRHQLNVRTGLLRVLNTRYATFYFTEEMLAKIHQKMADELAKYGAHVDAVYYCPHHPDDNCDCRKPKPKLAYQAMRDLNIEPRHSYVMGDRLMDMELASRIGSKSVMIPSETGRYELKQASIRPDYIAPDLATGARWIIQQESNLNPGSHQG